MQHHAFFVRIKAKISAITRKLIIKCSQNFSVTRKKYADKLKF